jgi:O-antigen ligase
MCLSGNKYLMLSIRNRIFGAVSIVSLLFVVYSGYVKWIPFLFMDPFVFFTILLLGVILFSGFRNNFKEETLIIGLIFLLFFTWAFITTAWGSSNVYFAEKIQKSIVIMVCFFSPFFLLRTESRFKGFINLFHLITFLTALTIFTFFIIYGDLFFVFYGDFPTEESTIPDYLALGVLLASGFILAIQKTGKLWLGYKTIIIIAIILLAPRGPLLTLVLFTIVYYITTGKFKFKWYFAVYTFIVGMLVVYFSEGLTDRLLSRFSGISDSNSSAFSSVGSRIELVNAAIDYFKEYPFLGIGYGSFGIKFTGFDDRIEPHNILFEIAAETGILGISLFLIFIFWVYNFAIRKKLKHDPTSSSLILLTLYLIVQSLSTTYLIDSKALFFWLSFLICYSSKALTFNEGKII